MDHYDPSQYPQNAGDGSALTDALSETDAQLQYASSAEYAGFSEIVGYHNPDLVNEIPVGDTYTRPVKELAHYLRSRPVATSAVIIPGATQVGGINFRETAGTTATIILYDGWDANGVALMYINLAANESVRDFMVLPIFAVRGLYAAITGTVQGIVYTRENQ